MGVFTKKRSQLKQAVTKMVQKAFEYIEKCPNEESMLDLIMAIRDVTEGKIYVEVERARVSKRLADIKENRGDIEGAASILQDLQVETYGSMEKREKIEFILEQMRLCLAKKDSIRTQIISKKISSKSFVDESFEPLKLKFYKLMIDLDLSENNYLNISKHFYEIYQSKSINCDEENRLITLKNVMIYLLLAPFDHEQNDLLYRHKKMCEKDLEKLTMIRDIIVLFCTKEVMLWRVFCDKYEMELKNDSVFSGEDGEKRWEELHNRIIEHNIRVMAEYYTQVRLSKMSSMLDIDEKTLEKSLCDLVVNKTIEVKIDRWLGIAHFTKTKNATEVVNDWSYNINQLLSLVKKTTHLINKEKMIHHVT